MTTCLLILSMSEGALPAMSEAAPISLGVEDSESQEACATAPLLHPFLLPDRGRSYPAVIVCPGGGYGGLAMDYEGEEVAQWLNRCGIVAFVLEYRVAPHRHPAPLHDAQQALRRVRAQAREWRIDPERLGILGFSAGGHLAATASTDFDTGDPDAADPAARQSSRPDFTILIYPVISLAPPFGHLGSRDNLLGSDPDPMLVARLCNERRITPETPPAFLVHTTGDSVVSAENSVAYYLALLRAGVPGELHIYEKGEHGYGMGENDPALSTWTGHCIQWLRVRGILNTE